MQQTFDSMDNTNRVDMVTVFDSLHDFVVAADALPNKNGYDRTWGSNWDEGASWAQTRDKARVGDMERAKRSDKLLNKLEGKYNFQSSGFHTVDAMSGGVANVPAMLSGAPIHMRRRQRVTSEQMPLNIVVDIASSEGIDSGKLERRGAAILALVRLLAGARPINLYCTVAALPSGASKFTSSSVAFRMDTSPLDLARAAHVFGASGFARQLGYAFVTAQVKGTGGSLVWMYSDVKFARNNGAEYWKRALGANEMLYIAPVHVSDELLKDPEKWLDDMIKRYGNQLDA